MSLDKKKLDISGSTDNFLISNKEKIILQAISGFYVAAADIKIEPSWVEFLHDNIKTELIFPPILRLQLNRTDLALEDGTFELVNQFSKDFVEYIINNV